MTPFRSNVLSANSFCSPLSRGEDDLSLPPSPLSRCLSLSLSSLMEEGRRGESRDRKRERAEERRREKERKAELATKKTVKHSSLCFFVHSLFLLRRRRRPSSTESRAKNEFKGKQDGSPVGPELLVDRPRGGTRGLRRGPAARRRHCGVVAGAEEQRGGQVQGRGDAGATGDCFHQMVLFCIRACGHSTFFLSCAWMMS